MKTLIFIFVFVCAFLGWIIYTNLDDPNLIPVLVILPFFVIATLFAIFGKELFKRKTLSQKSKGDQI